jgi:hypothetical protein
MSVPCTARPVHVAFRPVQHSERRPCISQPTDAGAQVILELTSRLMASHLPSWWNLQEMATPAIGCFGFDIDDHVLGQNGLDVSASPGG